MQDKDRDELFRGLRNHFNPPPETPREEMWEAIQARIAATPEAAKGEEVVSLDGARKRRWAPRPGFMGWAAAAAAVLVVGVGIGRMTAPGPEEVATAEVAPDPEVMFAAAVNHLVKTESLLTLVRADARTGRVEPGVATWARSLLAQTRLLLDSEVGEDAVMAALLEDLELVLVQILSAANAAEASPDRVRSELDLALNGMRERDVLPRLQAVIPAGPGYRGT